MFFVLLNNTQITLKIKLFCECSLVFVEWWKFNYFKNSARYRQLPIIYKGSKRCLSQITTTIRAAGRLKVVILYYSYCARTYMQYYRYLCNIYCRYVGTLNYTGDSPCNDHSFNNTTSSCDNTNFYFSN